jgi:hypothetical protein
VSITFPVSDVEVATGRKQPLDREATLRKLLHQPVEALYEGTGRLVRCSDANAFAEAVQLAFIEHRPLTLSPDALWLCIARGFAEHVNRNAETLRRRLVRHEGKLTLVVERPDFTLGQPNPWPEAFAAFGDEIAGHVGKLRDLVVANFSTTGPTERAASDVVLMDGFQAYFEYVLVIGCGIPSITLLGTPADWRSIRVRAAHFAEYGLEWWTKSLLPVLDQFVRAAEGAPDVSFWRSFFRYESGSGRADLTGWIHVLFPYLENFDGKRIPNEHMATWAEDWKTVDARLAKSDLRGPELSQLLPAVSSAPVKLIDLRTGNTHPLRFVAGLFGVVEDEATGAISPEIGWAVVHGSETGKKWELEPEFDEDGDEIDPVTGLKKRK